MGFSSVCLNLCSLHVLLNGPRFVRSEEKRREETLKRSTSNMTFGLVCFSLSSMESHGSKKKALLACLGQERRDKIKRKRRKDMLKTNIESSIYNKVRFLFSKYWQISIFNTFCNRVLAYIKLLFL